MKVNNSQFLNVYNTQNTGAARRNEKASELLKTPELQKAERSAQKRLGTQDAENAEKKSAVTEMKGVLSKDEMKMFELLFPAGKEQVSSNTPARSYGVQRRYNVSNKAQIKSTIGNMIDIRG